MDAYEEALRRLKRDERTLTELESMSGIPEETLRDIKAGITKSPRFSTLKKLVKFYQEKRATA
jgi:DNA-binding Xre family transcriptional regulator